MAKIEHLGKRKNKSGRKLSTILEKNERRHSSFYDTMTYRSTVVHKLPEGSLLNGPNKSVKGKH